MRKREKEILREKIRWVREIVNKHRFIDWHRSIRLQSTKKKIISKTKESDRETEKEEEWERRIHLQKEIYEMANKHRYIEWHRSIRLQSTITKE